MARTPGWIVLMPSLMAVPHLSHLVGLASPQMSTPTALRGPCNWGDGAVSLQPTVPPVLLHPAGSPPKLWRPCSQFLAVVNTSTSVCVRVCVRVSYPRAHPSSCYMSNHILTLSEASRLPAHYVVLSLMHCEQESNTAVFILPHLPKHIVFLMTTSLWDTIRR